MDDATKAALEEFQNIPPEEAAANIYLKLLKPFEIQLPSLSKKGLKRVLETLIKVPMVDINFKLDKKEQSVYYIASRLLEAGWVMKAKVLQEQMEETEQNKENSDGEVSSSG